MLTHKQVWAAIDALADHHGLSASGLARRSGLDPTSFNKSKRTTGAGRPRWPSTESIAKALTATDTPLGRFMTMVEAVGPAGNVIVEPVAPPDFDGSYRSVHYRDNEEHNAIDLDENGMELDENGMPVISAGAMFPDIPVIGFAQAGVGGFFDNGGFPAGEGWDKVTFPGGRDEAIYALEVSGDSMLPLYRDGDVIIVSPTAQFRKGDRVVAKTLGGEVMAKILARKTSREIELQSVNPDHENRQFLISDLEWVARILWVSQ